MREFLSFLADTVDRKHRRLILLATVSMAAAGLLSLLYPWLVARVLLTFQNDTVDETVSFNTLILFGVLLVSCQAAIGVIASNQLSMAGESITKNLRQQLFEGYVHTPWMTWTKAPLGDSLSRLINDSAILGHFFSSTIPTALPQIVAAIGACGILVWHDIRFAVLFLVLVLVAGGLAVYLGKRTRIAALSSLAANGTLYDYSQESLSALSVVKAFAAEKHFAGQFHGVNQNLYLSNLAHRRLQNIIGPACRAVAMVLLLVAMYIALNNAAGTTLNIEQATALSLYCLLAVRPMGLLSSIYGRLQLAIASFKRIHPLLDQSVAVVDDIKCEDLTDIAPLQQFKPDRPVLETMDLTFGYQADRLILRDVNLQLMPNTVTLIHGDNGTGKSTLAQLLLRLFDPLSGEVRLGDVPSGQIDVQHWRRHFGYVPQDGLLRRATLRENICLGRNFSDQQIAQATKLAQMDDMLSQMPDALDTPMLSAGKGLSGGQQQRVSMARAIIARPPLLILDEATSMLDPQSVSNFLTLSAEWAANTAILLISHDAKMADLADSAYEIRDGRLCS